MMTIILVGFFGLFWGSFLNVLIDRLPNNESILGRSRCDSCQKTLHFFDLWPVMSFWILLSRCRYCQNRIPRQHLVMELLTSAIFMGAFYHLMNLGAVNPLIYLKYFILISGLIVIGFQDFKYLIIMDGVVYAVAIPVLLINIFLGVSFSSLLIPLFGAIAFFGLQYFISKGAWLGAGDIWLGGLLGLAFGRAVFDVIVLGYVIGAILSIALLLAKKKELTSKMPLGTFLSAAGIIYLFFLTPSA